MSKQNYNNINSFRFIKIAATLFCVGFLFLGFSAKASAATYYWTGGANTTINSASSWTTDVNGACGDSTGGAVPGASDTVIFDSVCTNSAKVDTAWGVTTLTLNTAYSGTVTQTANLSISGDLTVSAGTLAVGTYNLAITGNSTVTGGNLTIGISSGTGWTTTNLTVGASGIVTATGASIITLSGIFDQSNINSKFEAGSSTITVNGNGSFTADGHLDSTQYNSATIVLNGTNNLTYNDLATNYSNGFNNLTCGQSTYTTTLYSTLMVRGVVTVGSGTLDMSGWPSLNLTSGNPLSFDSNSHITHGTLVFYGANETIPTLNNSYQAFILVQQNATVTQTGNITITGFNGAQYYYLKIYGGGNTAATGIWKTNGYNLSVGGNLTIGQGSDTALKKLDATNYTNPDPNAKSTITVTGNWKNYGTGGTPSVPSQFIASNSTVILNGTVSTGTITSGARNSPFYNLTQSGTAGTYTLQDPLIVTNNLSITAGTLDASASNCSSASCNIVVGGSWAKTGTFTPRTGTVTLNGTAQVISGANTFNNLTINAPDTVTFPSSTIQTINGVFSATGSSGSIITINASIPNTAATLSQSSGTVNCDYLSLKDSTVSGGTWNAGVHSTSISGNTGWTFSGSGLPVTSITVTGAGSATSVVNGNTLQMNAAVLPSNAANPTVTWSVTNGTGSATINSSTGLLTATGLGTVTVTASATDGSGVTGTEQITVVTAIQYYWVGGTTNSNTNNPANWSTSPGACADSSNANLPDSSSDIHFGGTGYCQNSATVNSSLSIKNFYIDTVYTGTVTQTANLSIAGDLTISAGTLAVGTYNLAVTGNSTVTSGNLTIGATTAGQPGWTTTNLTVGASGIVTATGASIITLSGIFDQSNINSKFEAGSATITINGNGAFTVDGTKDSTQYNSASVVINGTNSLTYNNLLTTYSNGFNNLTCGQSGNTTTLYGSFTVRGTVTVGSGTMTQSGWPVLTLTGATPLSFDSNSHITNGTLEFKGTNQTIPTLNNGYYSFIIIGQGTTVTQTGNITITGTNGAQYYYLHVNGSADPTAGVTATWKTAGYNLTVGGILQIGSGASFDNGLRKLDATRYGDGIPADGGRTSTITVTGNWLNYGNGTVPSQFIADNSTVILNGTVSTGTITSGARNSPFYNLTQSGTAGTYTLQDPLIVTNNLSITAGTLDASASNCSSASCNIVVGGSWAKTGTFTPRTGTVTLNGAGQSISGSTSFYNFTKSTTSTDTLTFAANSTQTISNTLTLNGAVNNILSLVSSSPNTQWNINPSGTIALNYLYVRDSDNTNSTPISVSGLSITSGGNNTNWSGFAAVPVTSITVTAAGSVTTVNNTNTLEMSGAVLPVNASNQTLVWSVTNGSGTATINSSTGLLTATGVGTVTVIASATDGSGITGTEQITITPNSTYYVSTTGSDAAAGTIGAPFASIEYAVENAAVNGDAIILRAGTYDATNIWKSGTNHIIDANKNITISAYSGESVAINIPSNTAAGGLFSIGGTWTFNHINFTNTNSVAYYLANMDYNSPTNVSFNNCTFNWNSVSSTPIYVSSTITSYPAYVNLSRTSIKNLPVNSYFISNEIGGSQTAYISINSSLVRNIGYLYGTTASATNLTMANDTVANLLNANTFYNITSGSTVLLENNIFRGDATFTTPIYANNYSPVNWTVNNNDLYRPQVDDPDYLQELDSLASAGTYLFPLNATNYYLNPQFNNEAGDDYTLANGTYLSGRGSVSVLPAGGDVNGNPWTGADIGAYANPSATAIFPTIIPNTVSFIGDSIAEGLGVQAASDGWLSPITPVGTGNLGAAIGGSKGQAVKFFVDRAAVTWMPQYVVLFSWHNNIGGTGNPSPTNLTYQQAANDTMIAADKARYWGITPIILGMIPAAGSTNYANQTAVHLAFNSIMESTAASHAVPVPYYSPLDRMLFNQNFANSYANSGANGYYSDPNGLAGGVHPVSQGYQAVESLVEDALKNRVGYYVTQSGNSIVGSQCGTGAYRFPLSIDCLNNQYSAYSSTSTDLPHGLTGKTIYASGNFSTQLVAPAPGASGAPFTLTGGIWQAGVQITQPYWVNLNSANAITAFSFPQGTGVINGTNIAVTVPYGTSVASLVATFTTTGSSVQVGSTTQVSGTTANDFTNPVTYTVTAADNSTQNYTVTVTVASATTYTLNVTSSNGTVTKNPSQSTYNSGTSVSLTATPNTGYVFSSWSGDLTSSVNPLTVTMDANKNITANFTVTGGGGGGLSSAAFMLFLSPVGSGISINNGDHIAYTRGVTLALNGGPDAVNMAISNTPDFYGVGQEPYQQTKQWTLPTGDGQKIVYAKFFNKWGQPSQTVTSAIDLNSAGATNNSSSSAITKTLSYGSRGSQVTLLQNKLKQLGFLSNGIKSNGNFGPATLKAVQSFQIKYNIAKSGAVGFGRVGPLTMDKLNKLGTTSTINNASDTISTQQKIQSIQQAIQQLKVQLSAMLASGNK